MEKKMGWRDLFHKKADSELGKVSSEVQRVDAWVMTQMPVYDLHLDVTIPKSLPRPKYIGMEEQAERYENYRKKSEEFIRGNFYEYSGDMLNLYELYQWTSLCLTTGIQMAASTPSTVLASYVNLNEAASYYDNVILKSEELCGTIAYNMHEIWFQIAGIVFLGEQKEYSEFILYEDGIKKIRDCGELECCEQFLRMFAECMKYAVYLFDVSDYIYGNVPYVFDSKGNYRVIRDWKKSYDNIWEHVNIGNKEFGTTTEEDFLKLIE